MSQKALIIVSNLKLDGHFGVRYFSAVVWLKDSLVLIQPWHNGAKLHVVLPDGKKIEARISKKS